MQRWVLERGGLVRGYLLTDAPPSPQEKRMLAFGPDDDGARPLEPEGTWRLVPPEAGLVGDDWTFDGTNYAPPVRA